MKLKLKIASFAMLGISLGINAQTIKYPVKQSSQEINSSPWYGLGESDVLFPGSNYRAIQLAGYYGLLFKTAGGNFSFHQNGNVGIGTTNPTATLQIGDSDNMGNVATEVEIKRLSIAPVTHNGSDWFFTSRDNNPYANLDIGYGNRKTLTIRHDGNVGIGTTNPTAKLDVHGDIYMQNNAARGASHFKIFRGTEGRDAATISFGENGSQNWFLGHLYYGGNLSPDLYISKASVIYNGQGTLVHTPEFTVRDNGNVGIGVLSPNAKLDVNGIIQAGQNNSTLGGVFLAQKYGGNDYIGTLSSNYSSGALILGYGAAGMKNQGTSGQLVSTFDNFSAHRGALRLDKGTLEFLSTPTAVQTTVDSELNVQSRFYIDSNGNFGIGTKDTKGFKLGVNGRVAALEIKVATYTNWSDFVFEKSYELPTLAEVENHIKEKGHLKDIPSAEEVKREGFYLGAMDAKLLQKIEELTLYTIQQQKEIEQLRKENNKVKEINLKLEEVLKRIDDLEQKK